MDRENIIKLAREAGFEVYGTDVWITDGWWLEELERFAALVVAAEREACAKACEDIPLPKDSKALTHLPTIERCATAIRARGNT
jgi:hypothetical protein